MISKKLSKRLREDAIAVSPVIATLMLVLVAVGAASAFYVWQAGWQSDVQDNVGTPTTQAALTIAGSTTVYEFTAVAADLFMNANPGYAISFQGGGSGAGVAAVGMGVVNIGSASRYLTSAEKATYPDLNGDGEKDVGIELVETVVAWDAVAVVTSSANTHGLVSMNETVAKAIFYKNGGVSAYSAPSWLPTGSDNKYQWNEIPAQAGGTVMCSGTTDIKIMDRDDESGTEEVFCKQIIDISYTTLEAAGIVATHYTSNQNLAVAIAADADALSFMSFGIATASGSGLKMVPFQGDGDSAPITPAKANIVDLTYDGARPLCYVTVGAPTGDVGRYIKYCLAPETNMNICKLSGYISLY